MKDQRSAMEQGDDGLARGDVVAGLEANELVEVQRVVPFGSRTLVEGVGLQSRRLVKRPLAADEFAVLEKVRGQQQSFDGAPDLFLLGAEAERIRIANQFDPLFAFEALGPAYTVALRVRGRDVEVCCLSDARHGLQEHLGYVWTTLVEDEEWILRRVGPVTLENTGIIPKGGGLRLKDSVEAFLRFTDKPMIASKDAVTTGLAQACADGYVGIGRGAAVSTLLSRHCGEPVSLDPTEDGVWIIPPFAPEPTEPLGDEGADGTSTGTGGRIAEPPAGAGSFAATRGAASDEQTTADRKVQRFVLQGEVPIESWGELFRCFVAPAARMNLKRLGLGVQFEMVLPEDGALSENDPALKTMKEAARQLGLTIRFDE